MNNEATPIDESRPRLALLMGDCTGIGPEIVAKVLAQGEMAKRARLLVVGDARVLELGIRDAKVEFKWRRVAASSAVALTRSRISLPGLKCGTRFGGICTGSPVFGLRPTRAGR